MFQKNYAINDGGGLVSTTSSSITMISDTFTQNYCNNENNTKAGGGALWLGNNYAKVSCNNCKFYYNYAWTNGGAIDANGLESSLTNRIFTFTNCLFKSNYCIDGSGGAVLLVGVSNFTQCTFNGNYNYRINGVGNDSVAAHDLKIGGAMLLFGSMNIKNSIFYNNYGEDSGALAIAAVNSADYTSYITECNFTGNRAKVFSGGAFVTTSNVIMKYSNFTNNYANLSGGAFVVSDGGDLKIYKCNFTNNTANNSSGGVADVYYNSNLYMESSILDHNKAGIASGAVTLHSGSVKIVGCIISNNYATMQGGAIASNGALSISNSVIINNSANEQGGAIEINQGTFYSNNNTYESNTLCNKNLTNGAGTAIYVHNSTGITITNNKFINNVAKYSGKVELIQLFNVATKTITGNVYTGNALPVTITTSAYLKRAGGTVVFNATINLKNPGFYGLSSVVKSGTVQYIHSTNPVVDLTVYMASMSNSIAKKSYTLPSIVVSGTYYVKVIYSDSSNNYGSLNATSRLIIY